MRHIHLGGGGAARLQHLLVIDDVHASGFAPNFAQGFRELRPVVTAVEGALGSPLASRGTAHHHVAEAEQVRLSFR